MFCKSCGKEIADGETVCADCGTAAEKWIVNEPKKKTPVFKKWWFWVIIVALFIVTVAASSGGKETPTGGEDASVKPTSSVAETDPPEEEGKIGDFIVKVKSSKITTNASDEKVIVVVYSFTNNGDEAESFLMSIDDKLFQNGVELNNVVSRYGIEGFDFDNRTKEIKPGVTIDVPIVYKLNDDATDIEVEIGEHSLFSNKTITYTIKISD